MSSISSSIPSWALHPPHIYHVTLHIFLHLCCVMHMGGQSQAHECGCCAPISWGTQHCTQLLYGLFPSPRVVACCSAAKVQDVGSAWSGVCAALATAGNLTCKSGWEGCLRTMRGRWHRCIKWQIKFSINGMYYWSYIKKAIQWIHWFIRNNFSQDFAFL